MVAVNFADDSGLDIDADEARLRRPGEEACLFWTAMGPVTSAPKHPADAQIDLEVSTVSDGAAFEIPAADKARQSDPDSDGLRS